MYILILINICTYFLYFLFIFIYIYTAQNSENRPKTPLSFYNQTHATQKTLLFHSATLRKCPKSPQNKRINPRLIGFTNW